MPYIPHTDDDVQQMLKTIGAQSIDDLFDEIPSDLRIQQLDKQIVPDGMTEMQAKREFADIAAQDNRKLCFIGAGAYEHHIPAAVWEIASRGEFLHALPSGS